MATLVHATETAFMKSQLGVESAWGNAVDSTIPLGSVTLTPSIKRVTNVFTARGILLPAVMSIGREHTEVAFDGKATYQEMGYFIEDVVSDAANPAVTSYSVEAGGLQIPGCVVTGWTLKGNRDEVTLSGSMLGQVHAVHAATPLGAPGEQIPVSAAAVLLSVDGAVNHAFEWELAVSDMWGGAAFIGDTTFHTMMQKTIGATFKFKVEAAAAGLAYLTTTPGEQVACSISTSADNGCSMEFLFNAIVGEPDTFSDEDGVYIIGHNLTVMNDDTAAIATTITPA